MKFVYTLTFIAVTSYVESTKSRVKRLLQYKREMSNDDMEKYGKKDADAYPFSIL